MAVTLHAHAHLPRHGSMRFGSSPGSMPVPVSLQITTVTSVAAACSVNLSSSRIQGVATA
jgi:hypothetical protein